MWGGLCLAITLGTTIWLGTDLYAFVENGGTVLDLPRRLLFVLLGETGTPVLPLMSGSFLAAVFCRRCSKQTTLGSSLPGDVSAATESA